MDHLNIKCEAIKLLKHKGKPWGSRFLRLDNKIMKKAMAPHSSTLAWKIPWTEELGGLPSMGLHTVGHD